MQRLELFAALGFVAVLQGPPFTRWPARSWAWELFGTRTLHGPFIIYLKGGVFRFISV
jgi:hypothetical protein